MENKKTTHDQTVDGTSEDDSPEAAIHDIVKMLNDTDTVSVSRVTELEEELDKIRKETLEANIGADTSEKNNAEQKDMYLAAVRKFSIKVDEQLTEYKEKSGEILVQERDNSSNLKELLDMSKKAHQAALNREETKVESMKQANEVAEHSIKDLRRVLASKKRDLKEKEEEIASLQSELKQSSQKIAAANRETVIAKEQIFKIREEMKKKIQGTGSHKKKAVEDTPAPRKKPKIET